MIYGLSNKKCETNIKEEEFNSSTQFIKKSLKW